MEATEKAVLSITIGEENGRALISVEDTGTGFGDRDLKQLQEPFHTTRASGDGMGLGLSISAAIIKEHNGELIAKNLNDGGARFVVSLPLSNNGE